ncbi:MAG: hypothetical protein CXZ00_00720 [Acidobacteria bacterium]|nr:MAG: hypothetical protein CXZ00_00720 [Acidobacteriota bacterium]
MSTNRVRLLALGVVAFLLCLPAYASRVRVVRLSLAQGDVQIDRNSGIGWEQAINNMPVIGGARIYAAENSKAGLEFEDGSSVRLVGPAQISLPDLSVASDGSLVNTIQVDSGMVYANIRLHGKDVFRILGPDGETFAVTEPSNLRFTVDEQTASLSVTEGAVLTQNNSKISAGETYNFVLGQPESAARQNSVPPQPQDAWNQERNSYEQYAAPGAQGGDDTSAYGAAADLSQYGSYSDIPGYGMVWQPDGVGPDWNPYDNGAWSYYPAWGWTFVSAHPWGWAPFYYGNWCYIGGRGWWWRPGHWGGHGGHGGGWHPHPRWTGNPVSGWRAPRPPSRGIAHGTVAVAGSHLAVGPIGTTHAPGAVHGFSGGTRAGSSIGIQGGRGAAVSNPVRGPAVSASGPTITGPKGAYVVSGGSGVSRNGFEVHRPAPGSAPVHRAPVARPYSYSGSSVPRASTPPPVSIYHGSSAPHMSSPHMSAPPSISSPAPHVSGGSIGGSRGGGFNGGFHGGSGGFHGGGGGFSGGGGHAGGGGHR